MSESSTAHASTAWPHAASAAARESARWSADNDPDAGPRRVEHADGRPRHAG